MQQMRQMQQSPIVSQLQQQQQQQNEYMSHSRNSSISRPTSMISVLSNSTIRSPSMASHRSSDDYSNSSIHLDNSIAHQNFNPAMNNQVQSMQIEENSHNENRNGMLNEIDLNNALQRIFSKIGTRDQTKQGIIELYEFQKAYPSAQGKVNTYLGQTGTYFQRYIRRGLSNLAAEDNEMTTASSMIPVVPTTAPVAAVTPNVVNSVNTSTQQFNSAEPTTISIPPASTVAEEQKRYSLEKPQQTQVRSNDAAEIKQRLLRLRQKFGYKNEVEEGTNNNTST
ncbi:hypothetical protein G6F68_010266 [Rhizopus microsporus]|nr:hypothetical protein G6F68_010266 [Rhizopus microsporus]